MINSTLNFLQGAVAQSRPAIIAAQISTTQPAPTSFTDPLYVQNPSQPDNFWTVTDWDADHGGTLPQQGAACALFYDYTGTLRCIWWDGMYSAPSPGGSAGGDLSGSFPDPAVAQINGVAVPLTGSAWIAPSLINSWVNAGVGLETAAYLKDPLGFVHLKGRLNSGASDTAAFVLPAGYRPGAIGTYGAARFTGTTPVAANVAIDVSGNVVISYASGTTDIGISGITFLAEN